MKGDDMKVFRMLVPLAVGALMLAACGGGEGDGNGGTSGGDGAAGLSLNQVKLAMDGDDYMNQVAWMIADKNYWPDLGFTKPAEVVASGEYIAGLIGGNVWVAQGESDVIWSALAEGSVPLKVIGVEKDTEGWFLGIRKGVDKNNLEGLKISGGAAGDRNITVGRHILEKMNVDPDKLDWVQVQGGSDERLQTLIAGKIDVAVLQPRHVEPLTAAGGEMVFQEYNKVPQEVWVVTEKTMKDNKDAVCAFLEGRVQAKQWASQGSGFVDNRDAAVAVAEKYNLKISKGDFDDWANEMQYNWALTGGASMEAFDQWNQDMIDSKNVPAGFDWKKYADFSCLTQVQEKLGLKVEPGNL
jgi:ABC-type nitrate/sulfonate/bicarbonate transport system substrate-binding protein